MSERPRPRLNFFWSSSADNLVLSEHDLVLAVVKHDDTSESMENGISEDGILPASEGIVHKSYLTLKTISFTYGITEIRRNLLSWITSYVHGHQNNLIDIL